MSLAIDTNTVTEVLIAGEWYAVENQSFDLDAYEFMWEGDCVHGGGTSGVCSTGFGFTHQGATINGPLTAIQAVRCDTQTP